MQLNGTIADLVLFSVEARVHLGRCLRQLRPSELIGGNRLWRITYAQRTWREIRSGHAGASAALRRTEAGSWSTGLLPPELVDSRRWCTWPLPLPHEEAPREVQAARSVA